jgi:hypothetical protein
MMRTYVFVAACLAFLFAPGLVVAQCPAGQVPQLILGSGSVSGDIVHAAGSQDWRIRGRSEAAVTVAGQEWRSSNAVSVVDLPRAYSVPPTVIATMRYVHSDGLRRDTTDKRKFNVTTLATVDRVVFQILDQDMSPPAYAEPLTRESRDAKVVDFVFMAVNCVRR